MTSARRICLDLEAASCLEKMISELRSLHCKMNRSELTSELLKLFSTKYFERESKSLEMLFFDEKRFLTMAIRSKETNDVEASLRKILKMKSQKK